MLVAVWDHSAGTSTSSCSNMIAPLSLAIAAVRNSQAISSYGVLPASSFCVKYLGKLTPLRSVERRAFLLIGCKSEILSLPTLWLRSTVSSPISIFPLFGYAPLGCAPVALCGMSARVPPDVVCRQGLYLYAVQHVTN